MLVLLRLPVGALHNVVLIWRRQGRMDQEAWAQDMCKKPLACGSDHQGLAGALVANLLYLTQAQQGLDSLIAMGKDMEILFRFVHFSVARHPWVYLSSLPAFLPLQTSYPHYRLLDWDKGLGHRICHRLR